MYAKSHEIIQDLTQEVNNIIGQDKRVKYVEAIHGKHSSIIFHRMQWIKDY